MDLVLSLVRFVSSFAFPWVWNVLGSYSLLIVICIQFNFTISDINYRLNCTFRKNASYRQRDGLGLVNS